MRDFSKEIQRLVAVGQLWALQTSAALGLIPVRFSQEARSTLGLKRNL